MEKKQRVMTFYNEDANGAVYPTPVVGMVGILEDVGKRVTSHFKNAGNKIALLGENRGELGGSEFLKTIHGKVAGPVPAIDLAAIKNMIEAIVDLAERELISSAHDISDGGLAVALAECCFKFKLGAQIEFDSKMRGDAALFGESRPLVIISYGPSSIDAVAEICARHSVLLKELGSTGGLNFAVKEFIDCPVGELNDIYETAIPRFMERISH